MYAENIRAPMPEYANSTVLLWEKNAAMNPNRIKHQRPPNRYGIQDVKSYFVWHANKVRATKIPAVRRTACKTIRDW